MKTYLVISQYLTDERIENYFKEKGWKRFHNKDKYLTLLYLDYLNIYKKKYYNLQCFIKNLVGEKKHLMTDKRYLHLLLNQKYFMKSYDYNLKENIENYRDIFKKNKKWILKPVKGGEGIGITIVENYQNLEDFFKNKINEIDFKRIKETDQWVIQEYIDRPLLFQKRKFHLRIYFLIVGKEIYYFNKFLIATAAKEYQNKNYQDKDIHDSHYNEKSLRNKLYPDDFNLDFDIEKDVENMFKNLKSNIILPFDCYPESEKCYEIFAADVMVTKDKKLKVLEFNHSVGYPETMDKRYPLFENQLDIVLHHFGLLEKINWKNNHFILI